MCGIVGYIGEAQAAPILLDGLSKLEYRGYDSAGIAVYDGEEIRVQKATGRLKALSELTHDGATMPGVSGIGHTRWATHGAPSNVNAHPHYNQDKTIAVVHNGIIENYMKLRKYLEGKGCQFVSETDTEVVAHLLARYYKGDPLEAVTKAMHRMEGSYALGIIFKDHADKVYAVRKDSPMIVGHGKDGNLIASDVPAVLKYTRKVYFIQNEEIAALTKEGITFFNVDGDEIAKEPTTIDWDVNAAEKGGYEHFMLKEMYEQPQTVKDTLNPRIRDGEVVIEELGMEDGEICAVNRIHIVACGSAYHAGVTAKYVFEGLARVPVEVDLASEFRYRNPILQQDDLVIIISQSGETLDTMAALREAKRLGGRTLAVCNVVGSSIAREADDVLYTWAGPEIAVATSKGYSTQLAALDLVGLYLADLLGTVELSEYNAILAELQALPEKMERYLENFQDTQYFASRYFNHSSVFYIGRNLDYAMGLEGSLKLKEISYIHSEAYASGELKHGTISLIEPGTLVVALGTYGPLFDKAMSNVVEVKARGAEVLAITTERFREKMAKTADAVIAVPDTHPVLQPSLGIVPLQFFAYYVALQRGCDIDKPRNLAKSVTVE